MKPKKKSKIDIKAFFINHVEKIAVALLIPLAIYIAYKGTRYEPLSWQPSELQQISDAADTHIRTNQRKAGDEGVAIIEYDKKATWIKIGVKPDLYRTDIQWMPSLFPEKIKRGQVNLFTVNALRAQSGLGALSINPASPLAADLLARRDADKTPQQQQLAAAANLKIGRRWAIVTGLIPIKRQLDEYVAAYSSSIHPDPIRDMPLYKLYDVERAIIEPGRSLDNLDWQKLDVVRSFVDNSSLWSTFAADPVDPTYIAPTVGNSIPMSYPLPPVDRIFGEEVAHSPEIPVLTKTQIEMMKQMEDIHKKMLKDMFDVRATDILDHDPFGGATGSATGGGMAESRTGAGGGNLLGLGAARRDRQRSAEKEDDIQPILVENYLFRFFDFDVETGKSYRYRVRLYLANPNYKLGPNFLLEESLAKEPTLITAYSEASNTVTIPLDARILATNVVAPSVRTPWSDPVASVLAIHFDLADGSEWFVERERVLRGSTINYARQEVTNPAIEIRSAQGMGMDEAGMGARPAARPIRPRPGVRQPAAKKEEPHLKTVDIVSDVCVLDILGGASLAKTAMDAPDLRSPGRIIVLEPSGSMVVRHVNKDLAEVETVKNPVHRQGAGMGGAMFDDGGVMP